VSFKKDFQQCYEYQLAAGKHAKATFTLNDQVMIAYYSNENNELLAVVRNILSQQLPINLFTSLKKEYSGYWITDLF
jgi:hypothetical protein